MSDWKRFSAIETFEKELSGLRAKLADKLVERRKIEREAAPLAEQRAAAESWVRDRASRWDPHFGAFAGSGRGGSFSLALPSQDSTERQQQEAFLCVALGDCIREVLIERLEARAEEHPPGLPVEERRKHLDGLDREIRELAEAEERLIDQAEDVGLEVERRLDADPIVILKIRSVEPDEPEERVEESSALQ